jgi:hypothetical protein
MQQRLPKIEIVRGATYHRRLTWEMDEVSTADVVGFVARIGGAEVSQAYRFTYSLEGSWYFDLHLSHEDTKGLAPGHGTYGLGVYRNAVLDASGAIIGGEPVLKPIEGAFVVLPSSTV